MIKKKVRRALKFVRNVRMVCKKGKYSYLYSPAIIRHMRQLSKAHHISFQAYMDMRLYEEIKAMRDPSVKNRQDAKLRSYIREEEYVDFLETVNSIRAFRIMRDKIKILDRLKAYCKRDYLDLRYTTIEDFRIFVRKHPNFVAKDPVGSFGKNMYVVRNVTSDYEADRWYDFLQGQRSILVEEMLVQHPALKDISPSGVACIRIHTLNTGNEAQVVLPVFIQCTWGGRQASMGGISLELDRETGAGINELDGHLCHPDTGVPLKGFVVPFIREAQQLVTQAALELPEVSFIGWDVAITPDGPVIIEGNGASRSFNTLNRLCMMREDYGLRREYQAILSSMRFHRSKADVNRITEMLYSSVPQATDEPDAVIILGSQKCGYRVEKAIEYLSEINANPLVIVSGGNLCGEIGYTHLSEAAYMKTRLMEAGIPEERILCEEESRNTVQNIENVMKLVNGRFKGKGKPVLSIVTGGFHMRRVFRDFYQVLGEDMMQLQAVSAYGNNTRPDNWYKNHLGIFVVMNELRALGIEIEGDEWRTANPEDVLLKRPMIHYTQQIHETASTLPQREGNVKGILLCCSSREDTPLCEVPHYQVCMDGTVIQKIPDDCVVSYIGKPEHKAWCKDYLCVEMELPAEKAPEIEAYTDEFFGTQVWQGFTYASELCAKLCRKYNLNSDKEDVLLSRVEASFKGKAPVGKYPEFVWDPHRLTMYSFRVTTGRIKKMDMRKK